MYAGDRLDQEWKKRHKRKQTRPRSICETDTGEETIESKSRENNTTHQEELSDELNEVLDVESDSKQSEYDYQIKQIKQKPLCSKLCIRKERRVQKSPVRKEPTLSSEEITDIINATNENTSSPCTTNRYRRHFLKQLRKAEARRCKESIDNESDDKNEDRTESGKVSEKEETTSLNDETELEEDNVIESKRMKIYRAKHKDGYECKVCQKKFRTTGLFMAHYICHSSFEKEHVKLESDTKDDDGSKSSHESGNTKTNVTENKSASNSDYNEESTYFCHVCNQRFNNIISLQSHMESHPDDKDACNDGKQREFYCNLCHKKFASAGSLHVHNKIHTGDNPYTCLKCNKSFRDKTRLTTHIRVHTGEKPFKCSVCAKSFSQKGNLKLHQKIHSGVRDCLCKICGSCFRLKSDLVRHMKVHAAFDLLETRSRSSSGQELSADDNQTSYSSSEDVLEHSVRESVAWISAGASKTGEESGMKNALETLRSTLNNRMNNSAGKGQALVDLPRKEILPGFRPEEQHLMMSIDSEVEFIKAMTTAKLRSTEDRAAAQRISCPLCGVVFSSIDNLNHHVLMQHNPLNTFGSALPPFQVRGHRDHDLQRPLDKQTLLKCKECGIASPSLVDFEKHMETHSTAKTSETNRCNVPVPTEDIAEPSCSQGGDKTYSCAMCTKVFRRSHHLQTHLRTHTGDRPYICPDCGKCFVRGDHLQNHRRTHTGEKPYTCEICHKSYSQSHHLLRHKRTHTGERPYKCMLCEKSFSRDHHLKKHMETHRCTVFSGRSHDNRSPPPSLQHHSLPKLSMVTRSSNRIAQMMNNLATEHSASRLMESMVKKHLLEQEKSNAHAPENIEDLTNENCESYLHDDEPMKEPEGKKASQSLKISDILDDEIPLGPQLSTGLVVDHVIKATQCYLGNVSKQRLRTARMSETDTIDKQNEYRNPHQVDITPPKKQLTNDKLTGNGMTLTETTGNGTDSNEMAINKFTVIGTINNETTSNRRPTYRETEEAYNERRCNKPAVNELTSNKTVYYEQGEPIYDKSDLTRTIANTAAFYESSGNSYNEHVTGVKASKDTEAEVSTDVNFEAAKTKRGKGSFLTLEDIVNQRLREEYNL